MNYEPNTTPWKKGDIVIHDDDAKTPEMLMKVIGIDLENALWITKYINLKGYKTARFYNDLKFLHSPRRFGLIIPNEETKEYCKKYKTHLEHGELIKLCRQEMDNKHFPCLPCAVFIAYNQEIF